MATEPSKDFIEIEPVTGVMTRMRRSYTMVYSIHCFDTQTNECQSYSQMPFPSLDMFKNKQFPVFNVTEELTINHEQFLNLVSYITDAHQHSNQLPRHPTTYKNTSKQSYIKQP